MLKIPASLYRRIAAENTPTRENVILALLRKDQNLRIPDRPFAEALNCSRVTLTAARRWITKNAHHITEPAQGEQWIRCPQELIYWFHMPAAAKRVHRLLETIADHRTGRINGNTGLRSLWRRTGQMGSLEAFRKGRENLIRRGLADETGLLWQPLNLLGTDNGHPQTPAPLVQIMDNRGTDNGHFGTDNGHKSDLTPDLLSRQLKDRVNGLTKTTGPGSEPNPQAGSKPPMKKTRRIEILRKLYPGLTDTELATRSEAP